MRTTDTLYIRTPNNEKWAVIRDDHDPLIRHVVPIGDGRPHSLDWLGYTCQCDPRYEPTSGDEYAVVVHSSTDGREFGEPDYCKPEDISLH